MQKFLTVLLVSASLTTQAEPVTSSVHERLVELSSQTGVAITALEEGINQAQLVPKIIETMERPWEAKPWYQYAPIFLTDARVVQGVEFWATHQETLARAEREYGVPAQVIVAIIGVETFYGRHKGTYPVIDALYTLGFHYPKRSAFFSQEFAHYIHLSQQQGWPLRQTDGSYAGAMGLGQFIPSSYLHYGVDFSGDGQVDMLNNPIDAIGSVANYFKKHHWQSNEPVVYQVQIAPNQAKEFVSKSLKPETPWSTLQQGGIQLSQLIDHDSFINNETLVALIELEDDVNKPSYWLILHNFYVITRYNHSPLYAMAVYQLSEQINDVYNQK